MADVHTEVEDKYDVDDAFVVPELTTVRGVASVTEPIQLDLDATYVDTADLRLAAAKVTLRRRTGGEDAGWHLKLPAVGNARTEIHRPPGRSARTPPKALVEQVRAWVRDGALAPVVRLRTTRLMRRVCGPDGQVLAEVCDDRVIADSFGTDAGPGEWREVEVELVDGDRKLLRAIGEQLVRAGARPSTSPSKLARALGRRREDATRSPDDAMSAGAHIVGYLREHVDLLKACDPQVRADESDSVHKMRVTTRRLRSVLGAYRTLFDRSVTEPVRAELKWLGAALGTARDDEVMYDRLRTMVDAQPSALVMGPVLRRLDRELRGDYRRAHGELLTDLDSPRYLRLLDSLDALIDAPPLTELAAEPATQVLPNAVHKTWRKLRRAARDADEPDLADEDRAARLHEVRKAAKRARYTADAAVPTFGAEAKTFAGQMKKLQSILGDHHDSVVCRDLLRSMARNAHRAGENTFTYGRLHALQEAAGAENERQFAGAWPDAARKKLRRWLR